MTSKPPNFLGRPIRSMDLCSSLSCPASKGNKASTISSSSCAYEGKASRGTTQQSEDKALFRTVVTSFKAGANLLQSRSASHICLILSASARAFRSRPFVGSWSFFPVAVISVPSNLPASISQIVFISYHSPSISLDVGQ